MQTNTSPWHGPEEQEDTLGGTKTSETEREGERQREGGTDGGMVPAWLCAFLAGLEAARTVLVPTSLKLWPNQA